MQLSTQFFARSSGSPAPNLTPTWQSLHDSYGSSVAAEDQPAIYPLADPPDGWYGATFDTEPEEDQFGIVDLGAGVSDPKERYLSVEFRKTGLLLNTIYQAVKQARAYAGTAAALNCAFTATVSAAGVANVSYAAFQPEWQGYDAVRLFSEISDYLYSPGALQVVVLSGSLAGSVFKVQNISFSNNYSQVLTPNFYEAEAFGLAVGDTVLFSATAHSAQLERTLPKKTWDYADGPFSNLGASAAEYLDGIRSQTGQTAQHAASTFASVRTFAGKITAKESAVNNGPQTLLYSDYMTYGGYAPYSANPDPYSYSLVLTSGANAGKVYQVSSFNGDIGFYLPVAQAPLPDFSVNDTFLVVPSRYAAQLERTLPRIPVTLPNPAPAGYGGSGGASANSIADAVVNHAAPGDPQGATIGEAITAGKLAGVSATENGATLLNRLTPERAGKLDTVQVTTAPVMLPTNAPTGYGGGLTGGQATQLSNVETKVGNLDGRLTPARAGYLDYLDTIRTGVSNLLAMTEVVTGPVRRFLSTALSQAPVSNGGSGSGSGGYDVPDINYKGTDINQPSFARSGRQILAITIKADGADYPVRTSKSRLFIGFVAPGESTPPDISTCTEVAPHGEGGQVQARILIGTADGTETMPIVNLAAGQWKAVVWVKDVEIVPLFTSTITITA